MRQLASGGKVSNPLNNHCLCAFIKKYSKNRSLTTLPQICPYQSKRKYLLGLHASVANLHRTKQIGQQNKVAFCQNTCKEEQT